MSESDKNDDTNYFSVNKYGRDKGLKNNTLVDLTDNYANYGKFVISFQHLATGKTVFFKAFVTDYSEAFTASWQGTPVYGRTDPIQTYSGTARNITLAFDVPAASVGEAYENMARISKLVQMLYPTYIQNEEGTGKIIGQAPLVRVKMMNLITNERVSDVGGAGTIEDIEQMIEATTGNASPQKLLENYRTSPLPDNGVLAAIGNINYKSDLTKIQVFEKAPNTILPQSVGVTMGFAVIHEETIGWDATTKLPLVESFPHKAILSTGADMQKLNADATYADIEVRRQQEEQNQAEADIREAQKNQFKMRLKGGLFGSKK
jgi:hypothetical protein